MISLKYLFILIMLVSCAPARILEKKSAYRQPDSKQVCYFVKQGDSLWGVSKRYGVAVEEIMRENNLSSSHDLKAGKKIVIPCRQIYKGLRPGSFVWPVEGEIVNFFGENIDNSINNGLNIQIKSNNEVKASADGTIVFADSLKGWGETLVIKHNSDLYTVYANLENVLLKEGSGVKKQQVIAKAALGKNGNFIIHFEIRKRYIPQNPLEYLN